jgi:hypothetical protein
MRHLISCLLFLWTCPLVAQPVKIKFAVEAEVTTEMTSVTELHVITTQGPYNLNEIRSMSFWGEAPDTTTLDKLRYNGIGIYLKGKYLKPLSVKSDRAWEAKVKGATLGNDTIRMVRNTFYLGSAKMGTREILTVLESNPASHAEAKKARSNFNGAQITGFVGGALIGWPLGQAISGKVEPQWGLAAVGAATLLGFGIPLTNQFKRHTRNAIKLYNNKTPLTGSTGLSIKFYPGVNGGTLLVKF